MEAVTISRVSAQVALEILRHPEILPAFCEDVAPEDYDLPDDESHIYLLVEGEDTHGVCIFAPISQVLFHAHVAFLPGMRKHSIAGGKLALEWMFSYPFIQTIITMTPADNRLALWYARHVGFKKVGTVHQGIRRKGVFGDFIISEVVRP